MTNKATFQAVRNELESTINLAKGELEAFSTDLTNISAIQKCTDLITQIRGIFVLIEDAGAALSCEEVVHVLNMLPIDGSGTVGEPQLTAQFEAISQALVMLARYIEYLELEQPDLPVLLIPSINIMRKVRQVSVVRESHFFEYTTVFSVPASASGFAFDASSLASIKQYRLMYQTAFVYLLKKQKTSAALSYMAQALQKVAVHCQHAPIEPMFVVAQACLLAMSAADAHLSLSRKLLLSDIDRQLKALINEGESAFAKTPNLSIFKDLLYVIATMPCGLDAVAKVINQYQLTGLAVNEQIVRKQQDLLFSPGKSVLNSLSLAIKEDLDVLKELVNTAARTDGEDFDAQNAASNLQKIADVLLMIGLPSPSNVLKTQAQQVSVLVAPPTIDQLLSIADAVLYCETAVARINKESSESDEGLDEKQIAMRSLVNEAKVVLIDQAESGLSATKRAISSFMDSKGDKTHLNLVMETLTNVRGAFIFLESQQAAQSINLAHDFVEKKLLQRSQLPTSHELEAFADGVSSLEFFLEGLLSDQTPDEDVLDLAEQSLDLLRA